MKTWFKSIPEERKVRELPRKMRRSSWAEFLGRKSAKKYEFFHELPRKMNIEEVEGPKKYENYHEKPVSDPFKSIADRRKVR